MSKGIFIIIIISIVCTITGYGADMDGGDNPQATPEPTPVPYEKEEFPQWTKDLRRAEVVMFGSIPFTFFASIKMFNFYHELNNSTVAPENEEKEKLDIVITAVSLSVCIAIADYIIVKVTRKNRPGSGSK